MDLLHRVAAPTGARGSILLMSGGLLVLGFLFLVFVFRSAIVGDLAPVANAHAPVPRARLPPSGAASGGVARALPSNPFEAGREVGRGTEGGLDAAFARMASQGVEVRIVRSDAEWKLVRLYRCLTCDHGAAAAGCEHERGLLAGTFETLAGGEVRVHESSCRASGAERCEFEIRHAPLRWFA